MSRPYLVPLSEEDVIRIREMGVDPIEVIACVNCKYAAINPREQALHQYICTWHDMSVSGTYFCGSGERKEE